MISDDQNLVSDSTGQLDGSLVSREIMANRRHCVTRV